MNYYAQGGQAHGLKSLTGHKIQTKDGVPSFGIGGSFQRNFMKPVTNAVVGGVKAVQNVPGIKQVSDVSTQAFKPIDQALVGFDKAVGRAIPGGWGTIAQVAASMIPGAQPLAIGLGAANGSGVMRKGGNFNLQGAMIGGATAYATSELGEYLRAAGGAPDAAMLPVAEGAVPVSATAAEMTADEIARNSANQMTNAVASESANVLRSVPQPTSFMDNVLSGNVSDAASQLGTKFTEGASQFGTDLMNAPSDIYKAGVSAKDAAFNYDYGNALKDTGKGMSDTVSGIKSVLTGNINPAAAAAVKSGATMAPMMATAGTGYGIMNLADQEAKLDYLKQQQAAGNIAQAEYDQAVAEIARQRDYASNVVSQNPLTIPKIDVSGLGSSIYSGSSEPLYRGSSETLYAMGGSVDDESGMDEARGLGLGNLSNGFMNMGSTPAFAAGGMPPRFLSGGGDGMSDDIPATINGNQEARLADGEFVVPADVVSHLGNGSSKAGAKQLYSMMDKVRTARTGRKSQGKQINPRKYLAA
jgi:hypothetical protein